MEVLHNTRQAFQQASSSIFSRQKIGIMDFVLDQDNSNNGTNRLKIKLTIWRKPGYLTKEHYEQVLAIRKKTVLKPYSEGRRKAEEMLQQRPERDIVKQCHSCHQLVIQTVTKMYSLSTTVLQSCWSMEKLKFLKLWSNFPLHWMNVIQKRTRTTWIGRGFTAECVWRNLLAIHIWKKWPRQIEYWGFPKTIMKKMQIIKILA